MQALEMARPGRLLDAPRILELANKAHFLYVKQDHAERVKLLKIVLSNFGIDAVSLYPTYSKPFALIFLNGRPIYTLYELLWGFHRRSNLTS